MVFVYVWGAWHIDGGWMPLPTHPQRYCDPASLVFKLIKLKTVFDLSGNMANPAVEAMQCNGEVNGERKMKIYE